MAIRSYRSAGFGTGGGVSRMTGGSAQAIMARNQANRAQGGPVQSPMQNVAEARDQIEQRTAGQADRMRDNPQADDLAGRYQNLGGTSPDQLRDQVIRSQQVMAQLQPMMQQLQDLYAQAGDAGTPFDDSVMAGYQSQIADQQAGLAASQMDQMRQGLAATGGSIYDRSFQSAGREVNADRLAAQNAGFRDVSVQADVANAAARERALQLMAQLSGAQAGLQAQSQQAQMQALAAEDNLRRWQEQMAAGYDQGAVGFYGNQFADMPTTPPSYAVSPEVMARRAARSQGRTLWGNT